MTTPFPAPQQKYLDKQFANIDAKFKESDRTFIAIKHILRQHDERFERLEEQIANLPTREEFYSYMDAAMGRLTRYEDEHGMMHGRIARCEQKLGLT